jgi:RNA polymerase sigma-54 factor
MLQLPILELRSLIQQELEKNPTLEERPSNGERIEVEPGDGGKADNEKDTEMDFKEDFETLAKLDDEWRSYFFQDLAGGPYTHEDAEKRQFLLDSLPHRESLQEHLIAQLNLAGLSENDRQIGELIVGSINDDGYLTMDIAELSRTAALDHDHVTDVLAIIQEFDPTGVGAHDLRECLMLQLHRLGREEDSLEYQIVDRYLEKLAGRKFHDIARALKVSHDEIKHAVDFVSSLDPKPGHAFSADVATYVYPEVLVQKVDGEYVVMLDDDQLPRLRISKHYRRLMDDPSTSAEVKDYILRRVRSGVFLIRSIQQRQQTLLKIAREIVRVQESFLDNGLADFRPLTMSQVADVVGVHETTVSRAVAGKYMRTPIGLFEMKYFFSHGLKTASGQDISNRTVRDRIAQLVAAEAPDNPLTDHELVAKLEEEGVKIARRTVAKYRLVLHIPPSHMRKSY